MNIRRAAWLRPRRLTIAFVLTLLVGLPTWAVSAGAAVNLTVAQAIASQSGTATVTGYVVGQPTATNTPGAAMRCASARCELG